MNMKRLTIYDVITLIALLFVVVLLVVSIIPCCASGASVAALQMKNSTKVRAIHSAMVLFSNDNNSYYPGIMADGVTIDPRVGLTPQSRVARLIELNMITQDDTRSIFDSRDIISSYALLQISVSSDDKTIVSDGRSSQWRSTNSDSSVVISDRAVAVNNSWLKPQSLHTQVRQDQSGWRGSVGWNDNHVTFENTQFLRTKYAETVYLVDDLFTTPVDSHVGNDALMVWSGTNKL